MPTPVTLAVFDVAPNGKRVGTLEIADILDIKTISYGVAKAPTSSTHTIEIQVVGAVRSFIVCYLEGPNADFIALWKATVTDNVLI